MNIIDAVKSGKRFRRPGWFKWCQSYTTLLDTYPALNGEDILADDWQIEEESVTVTRSQVEDTLDLFLGSSPQGCRGGFLKALGFKE